MNLFLHNFTLQIKKINVINDSMCYLDLDRTNIKQILILLIIYHSIIIYFKFLIIN